MDVKVYKDTSLFLDHLSHFDVADNPYQCFAFYEIYLKYHARRFYRFYELYDVNRLIGIVPLECYSQNRLTGVKKLRFIGYRHFNYEQYICLPQDTKNVHKGFIEYLRAQERKTIVNFYDINNKSPLFKILDEYSKGVAHFQLYVCPCLHFYPSFDDFFKTTITSSKKRSELKKFQKRLGESGTLRMVNITDGDSYSCNQEYVDQIYELHQKRFANVYATSFFGKKEMKPYYSELIKSLAKYKKALISLLVLDNIVISFIFCLSNGKEIIDWIPAFDPDYSKYSLGNVHYKMFFEYLCIQQYETFDFSKGTAIYKSKWAKEQTINNQFIINVSPNNLMTTISFNWEKNRFRLKSYLREKGVLSLIKHWIGKVQALKIH